MNTLCKSCRYKGSDVRDECKNMSLDVNLGCAKYANAESELKKENTQCQTCRFKGSNMRAECKTHNLTADTNCSSYQRQKDEPPSTDIQEPTECCRDCEHLYTAKSVTCLGGTHEGTHCSVREDTDDKATPEQSVSTKRQMSRDELTEWATDDKATPEQWARAAEACKKHRHYFKPCKFNEIDVYRVLLMFDVTDPCIQHATKKLLCAGGRGAGKDTAKDVQEAIDTLLRWNAMREEEIK